MNLWRAELVRCWREPGQRWILAVAGLAWLLAGVLGGMTASEQRSRQSTQWRHWESALEARLASASRGAPSAKLAGEAFDVGRHFGPHVTLPGGPGLALVPRDAVGQTVGIETRHFEARRAEPLKNPALATVSGTGLAWLIAVLLPLALISASHGVRLGDRDAGRWRWIVSLSRTPWRSVAWALGLRACALTLLAWLASCVALGLDSAVTPAALLAWLAALLSFALTWTVLVSLVLASPMSAGGGTLSLIGLWALTTFAVPAVLGEAAHSGAAMPSRLFAVVESRKVQQDAEARDDTLLAEWYRRNASMAAALPDLRHAWPVSFVPRYLETDRLLRPLMASFDDARARQEERLNAWAWLSPALSLLQAANALAGHTAARHLQFARELARREDAWRGLLVPAIMSYRGLSKVDPVQLKAVGEPVTLADETLLRR